MAASDLINLSGLLDDAKCFALVRQHRWPEGVRRRVFDSGAVIRGGHDDMQPCRQRYRCKACDGSFDDRPERCWPGTTSRCARGCCAFNSWAWSFPIGGSPWSWAWMLRTRGP